MTNLPSLCSVPSNPWKGLHCMSNFTRSFPLLDLAIRSEGDGRTVEAYAAIWDTPTRVKDGQGKYLEQISRTAFDQTLAERGDKPFPVLFNHGLTVHGTPSDLDSMPIGASIEPPRVDSRGLVTVSRYHNTERADQALEAIRSGAVTAQSFSGTWGESSPAVPRGGYHPTRSGDLVLVTRRSVAMREYGPAVFAMYPGAQIMSVRSDLNSADQALLNMLLVQLAASDAALDPIVDALCAADGALDAAQMVISKILQTPNPDDPEDDAADPEDMPMAMASANLTSLAQRLNTAIAVRASGTPTGVVADEHRSGRSPVIARNAFRAALLERGIRNVQAL